MADTDPAILTGVTEEYLRSIRPDADDLVEEMEAHAREEGIPIASRDVASFQAILTEATDAGRALEIGTAIGYTTIHLARTGCEVVTLERDAERIAAAREYIDRAGVADRIEIVEGDALETLAELDETFDLAFVDGLKTEYAEYLDLALPLVRSGGLIVVDNLLWSGRVPEAAHAGNADADSTAALVEFNETFVNHDDLSALVMPLGDGTGIAVKR